MKKRFVSFITSVLIVSSLVSASAYAGELENENMTVEEALVVAAEENDVVVETVIEDEVRELVAEEIDCAPRACHFDDADLASFDEVYEVSCTEASDYARMSYGCGTKLGDFLCYQSEFEIYQAFANSLGISPELNGVGFQFPIESREEAYDYIAEYSGSFYVAMDAFLKDHPEKFAWATGTTRIANKIHENYVEIVLSYVVNPCYTAEMGAEFDAIVYGVAAQSAGMNEVDAIRYISSFVMNNGDLYGEGTSAAYAKSFQSICNAAGITSMIVESEVCTFNYVLVEGQWYMVDTACDYFLVSNTPVKNAEHATVLYYDYPETSDENYKFESDNTILSLNGNTIKEISLSVAKDYVAMGNTEVIEVLEGIENVCFQSDDESRAVVDENGVITAVAPGYVTFTVSAMEDANVSSQIKMLVKPVTPTLNKCYNTSAGVKITWNAVDGVEGYLIQRRVGDGSYETYAWVKDAAEFVDNDAKVNGEKYSYRVMSYVTVDGKKVFSKSASKTSYYLGKTKISKAKAVKSGVKLTFAEVKNATYYKVMAKYNGSDEFVEIGRVEAGKKSFTDKNDAAGEGTVYKVTAMYTATKADGTTKDYKSLDSKEFKF